MISFLVSTQPNWKAPLQRDFPIKKNFLVSTLLTISSSSSSAYLVMLSVFFLFKEKNGKLSTFSLMWTFSKESVGLIKRRKLNIADDDEKTL